MEAAEIWEEESSAASEGGDWVLLALPLGSCVTQTQALHSAEPPLSDP